MKLNFKNIKKYRFVKCIKPFDSNSALYRAFNKNHCYMIRDIDLLKDEQLYKSTSFSIYNDELEYHNIFPFGYHYDMFIKAKFKEYYKFIWIEIKKCIIKKAYQELTHRAYYLKIKK